MIESEPTGGFKHSAEWRERNRGYAKVHRQNQLLFNEAMRLAVEAMCRLPLHLDAYGRSRKADAIRRAMKMVEDCED